MNSHYSFLIYFNMKSIIKMILIILLVLFSFFYTSKSVEWLKNLDPIMKQIKTNRRSYETKSVNAIIDNDIITPGVSGIKVDVDKSYSNMKKMNKYNPNYYVYTTSNPDISMSSNKDKYIIKGNYLKNQVALIFKVSKESELVNYIYSKLEEKNIIGTFFIDGVYLKNDSNIIYDLAQDNHEIELLDYNGELNQEYMDVMRNNLKSIINYSGNYCLLNNKDKSILDLCSSNNMYTVIPTFVLNNFSDLRNNLESGVIIEVNNNRIKELSTIINYIKQKGYNIVSLQELLSENRTTEK